MERREALKTFFGNVNAYLVSKSQLPIDADRAQVAPPCAKGFKGLSMSYDCSAVSGDDVTIIISRPLGHQEMGRFAQVDNEMALWLDGIRSDGGTEARCDEVAIVATQLQEDNSQKPMFSRHIICRSVRAGKTEETYLPLRGALLVPIPMEQNAFELMVASFKVLWGTELPALK